MTFSLSPKVYLPVLIGLLAAVALTLLTGDKTFLVGALVSLTAGGAGVAAPPAPAVSQAEVAEQSRVNRANRIIRE